MCNGVTSSKLLKEIAFFEDIKFDKVEKGIPHILSTNEKEFENARRVNEIYKNAGLNRWEVSSRRM